MARPCTNPRLERKLGRTICQLIIDVQRTPVENVERFAIVKRQLTRAVAEYRTLTGFDRLDPDIDYGYRIEHTKPKNIQAQTQGGGGGKPL